MNSYYFTFGLDSPFSEQYVKINAEDVLTARNMMFALFGSQWAFCYSEKEIKDLRQKYNYTELMELFQSEKFDTYYGRN
jgi:hypothetical protein